MANVNVLCKLDQDLICELPGNSPVVLNGSNTTWPDTRNPRGAGWPASFEPAPGTTSVDETFITAWLAANAALPMVANGLIAIAS